MEQLTEQIRQLVTEYFGDDKRRIQHAFKVFHQAEIISGEFSGFDPEILAACSLLHDVGIRVSEERHGYNNGRTQEKYGPPVAGELLNSIGFPEDKILIVKQIIGNHHSVTRFDYRELVILKEADRIVNRQESRTEYPQKYNLTGNSEAGKVPALFPYY